MDADYQRLEIDFLPCNSVNIESSLLTEEISPDCHVSLAEQIDYVRESHWLMLVNEEHFNPENFNDESIEYSSVIKNI